MVTRRRRSVCTRQMSQGYEQLIYLYPTVEIQYCHNCGYKTNQFIEVGRENVEKDTNGEKKEEV